MKKLPLLLVTVGIIAISFFAIYTTFIYGRTYGPDCIEAIRSGRLHPSAVKSIDVVAHQVGSMPFRASEYARLKKLAEITTPSEIKGIIENLSTADRQFPNMNHPVVNDVCYLRINTENGWYWIYCNLLDDGQYRGLEANANTMNATNPNGGRRYFLYATDVIIAAARMKK